MQTYTHICKQIHTHISTQIRTHLCVLIEQLYDTHERHMTKGHLRVYNEVRQDLICLVKSSLIGEVLQAQVVGVSWLVSVHFF